MKTVGLVGTAARSATLIQMLTTTQTRVALWTPGDDATHEEDQGSAIQRVPREALSDLPLVFFDVPEDEARATARTLGDVLSGRHAVVHCLRTLEPGTGATISRVLNEETPTHRIGFLTGPMRPDDIANDRLAAAVVATSFPELHEVCARVLLSERCRLYRSNDLTGAELSAAYSKALAFVIGVAQGMEQGRNITAVMFTRGLSEISALCTAHGGKAQTAFGMSGSGNLFADVSSPGSPEASLGAALVREGAAALETDTARALFTLVQSLLALVESGRSDRAILLRAAAALLSGGLSPEEAAEAMMNLPVFDE